MIATGQFFFVILECAQYSIAYSIAALQCTDFCAQNLPYILGLWVGFVNFDTLSTEKFVTMHVGKQLECSLFLQLSLRLIRPCCQKIHDIIYLSSAFPGKKASIFNYYNYISVLLWTTFLQGNLALVTGKQRERFKDPSFFGMADHQEEPGCLDGYRKYHLV